MHRPDLSDYDNPLVPNTIERHYNDGLALGEELERAYETLKTLLSECYHEAYRSPETAPFVWEDIERNEDEKAAMAFLGRVGEWLESDDIAVFERDPVGTVKHFAKLAKGWSSITTSGAWREGIYGEVHKAKFYGGDMGERFYFKPTEKGEARIRAMFAAAERAANNLADEDLRPAMQDLLESFEQLITQARNHRNVLSDGASRRMRQHAEAMKSAEQ